MNAAAFSSWDPFAAWPRARPWLWAFLALWIGYFQGPSFLHSLRPARDQGIDFFQEWASARNLRDGLPVYGELQDAIKRHLGSDLSAVVEINAHPPTSVLLVAPLAWLDYPDAALAWNLLSLACLVASLWLMGRELAVTAPWWAVFPAIALALLCNPLRQQVNLGQLNLLLLLLFVGIWASARNGRPWLAGGLLGLATAVKLFPGFLFLYFALRRQGKVVAAGTASFLMLTALTAAVMGAGAYRTYVAEALPRNERSHSGWKNASIPGLWKKLFDPATRQEYIDPLLRSPILARVGALACCLAIVLLLSRAILRAQTPEQQDQTFGLALIVMLLVSPIAWDHYFILLLLPLAVMVRTLPPDRWVRFAFAVVVLVLWLDPAFWHEWIIPGPYGTRNAAPWQTLTALSFQCYALLGLFALGLFMFFRGAPRPSEEPAPAGALTAAGV